MDRFLYSLGIPLVGEHVARVLMDAFHDIDSLAKAKTEYFRQVPGIGPEVSQSVAAFFHERKNIDMLDRLKNVGVEPVSLEPPASRSSTALNGKTVVFTGGISLPRPEAKKLVKRQAVK